MNGKRLLCILAALLILLTPTTYVYAQTDYSLSGDLSDERQLPRLVDDADLLSESEEGSLLRLLDDISQKREFDVVVVTVDGIGERTPMQFADDFYDYNGYGAGVSKDGALLLVSMEERDWYISTKGFGITAITDAGRDYISDQFVSYLSDGDYYRGFETYARLCDEFVTQARQGAPYDRGNMPKGAFPFVRNLLIALGIGTVSAFVIVMLMKGKLKSVRFQDSASGYIRPGSMELWDQRERYLYSSIAKTLRPKDTDSGSSGSSTHTSSSGSSHGGGGGKF